MNLHWTDWLALAVIAWTSLAVVAGPIIGTLLDRADRASRRGDDHEQPLVYRPPREH